MGPKSNDKCPHKRQKRRSQEETEAETGVMQPRKLRNA